MTTTKKLTKEQIALCFGERIGDCVETKDIRVRGNWLFYRTRMGLFDRYDKEVECYWAKDARYNSGVLCMEAWDAVEYENSPFIPKNDKKVSIELKRLDDGYQLHLYEQTEEGQLEKRQNEAVFKYLNNGDICTEEEVKFLSEILFEAWFALDVRNMSTEKRKMYSSINSKIKRLNK